MNGLKGLQKIIGYEFKDEKLLLTAVTHPSYANQHGAQSYQRLEYLGDAILGFIVAEELYERFPDADEGVLTDKRQDAVSKRPLGERAEETGMVKYLKIAPRVDITDKIRCDLFEAVVAAVYLDGGIEQAKKFALRELSDYLDTVTGEQNYKSRLNEALPYYSPQTPQGEQNYKSRLNEALPHARITYRETGRSGPDHAPVFSIELDIDGEVYARAEGKNKKKAGQECARIALKKLFSGEKK